MSFSLAIADGDISIKGSAVGIVSGIDKLNQDLSIWLRERYQSDRFHLTYGSVLDNFIGGVIDSGTVAEVRSEVMRVLQNYQSLQLRLLKSRPEALSGDEILLNVDDISVRVQYDAVQVNIRFTNAKRSGSQLSLNVGLNG